MKENSVLQIGYLKNNFLTKENSILQILALCISIFVALLYVAGLNYYHSYLREFGFDYQLFDLDFNNAVFLGGVVFYLLVNKALVLIFLFTIIPIFSMFIFDFLLKKNYLPESFFSKKSYSFHPLIEKHADQIAMIVLIFAGVLFACIIYAAVYMFSSNLGYEKAKKVRSTYLKSFSTIKKNKNQIKDSDLFHFYDWTTHRFVPGYIVAETSQYFGVFLKEKGTCIISSQNGVSLKKGYYICN